MLDGRIVEERKNYYLVDVRKEQPVRAVLKGVIRKKQSRLAVGDYVTVELFDNETQEAIIRKVKPRINALPRPVIANIDQVLFVNCFQEPRPDFISIDNFLFAASVVGVPVVMLFNKIDLLDDVALKELNELCEIYQKAGYQTVHTTTTSPETTEMIAALCKDKLSVFAGPSGVGKSSLMQKLFPEKHFTTNTLSKHILRGKNTTTHTSLLVLDNGGFIADTPGFSFMKIPRISPREVPRHFYEIEDILHQKQCRFANCLHKNEPDCVIKTAVEEGTFDELRYTHYLDLLGMMEIAEKQYHNPKEYL